MNCHKCGKQLNGKVALAIPNNPASNCRSLSYFCDDACRIAHLTSYRKARQKEGHAPAWVFKPVSPLTPEELQKYSRFMPPYIPKSNLREYNQAVRIIARLANGEIYESVKKVL
jgi:hypothetical protein